MWPVAIIALVVGIAVARALPRLRDMLRINEPPPAPPPPPDPVPPPRNVAQPPVTIAGEESDPLAFEPWGDVGDKGWRL